jgi:hypothetical protein
MSYQNLPLEQRMKQAAEYAVILANEISTPEAVMAEIASVFFVTPQQAAQAYANSKVVYKSAHHKANIKNTQYLLALAVVSAAFSFFYLFLAYETGNDMALLPVAILLFSMAGICSHLVRIWLNNTAPGRRPWYYLLKKTYW